MSFTNNQDVKREYRIKAIRAIEAFFDDMDKTANFGSYILQIPTANGIPQGIKTTIERNDKIDRAK